MLQVVNVKGELPALGAIGLVTGMHTMPLLWSRLSPPAAWAPIALAAAATAVARQRRGERQLSRTRGT